MVGKGSILGDGDEVLKGIRGRSREEGEGMTFGVYGGGKRVGRQAAGGWWWWKCVVSRCVW